MVEELLVIVVLLVPLVRPDVAEVVSERYEEDVGLVQLCLFTVLIEKNLGSGGKVARNYYKNNAFPILILHANTHNTAKSPLLHDLQ